VQLCPNVFFGLKTIVFSDKIDSLKKHKMEELELLLDKEIDSFRYNWVIDVSFIRLQIDETGGH
jgi:hypothetical protein